MMTTEKPISPFLLGAGIVRGLTVTRQTDQNIVLESGYGYSSDGLPFFCEETLFRHYKPLSLSDEPTLAKYFFNAKVPTTDFKFWELLSDKDSHTAETRAHKLIRLLKPQSPADTEGYIFLDDKAIIVYRNSEKEPVRVLLMLKKYVAVFTFPDNFKWQDIVKQDNNGENPFSIWGDRATTSDPSKDVSDLDLYVHLHPVLQLPVLAIRRFGYGELVLEDYSCDDIYDTLFCRTDAKKGNVLTNFDSICTEYALIIDEISCQLEDALSIFHGYFGGLLGKNVVATVNAYWEATEKRWQAFKEQTTASDKTAIQYWYDVFADLTTAYNELRAEALRVQGQVAGDTKPFARHLVLGSLPAEPTFAFSNPFRTAYQQPPIFNGQAEQLQRVRFLHWRLVMMMKCFFAPAFDWDDGASDSTLAPTDKVNADNPLDIAAKINLPIRLTPSRPLSMPLGQRAIPFYFDLEKSEQSLHWYWDFDATQQNRITEHLSYHSENEAAFVKQKDGEYYAGTEGSAYSQITHIVHPFAFDLKAYPFVRIEGHIGKISDSIDFKISNSKGDKKPIKEILADLAKQYNICFDVELLPTSALTPKAATEAKAATNTTPAIPATPAIQAFCGKCLEHLGGVYHGGTFVIFYEEIIPTSLDRAAPKTYKIVADFTHLK